MEDVIDPSAPEWSAPSHVLSRPVLAAGSAIELDGYRRPIEGRELGWMHAAMSAVVGRPHGMTHQNMAGLIRQSWTLRPWPCQSGLAAVWWDEADAAAAASRRHAVRIGRVEVEMRFSAPTRIHAPPAWLPGAYIVRIEARSPVAIARSLKTGGRLEHYAPTNGSLMSGLQTIERKLGLDTDVLPALRILSHKTEAVRTQVRGKTGRITGWMGHCDVVCSARARWLLECASRGLGIGGRCAYGFGAIYVRSLETPEMRVAS